MTQAEMDELDRLGVPRDGWLWKEFEGGFARTADGRLIPVEEDKRDDS